jgi:hypothetical protein
VHGMAQSTTPQRGAAAASACHKFWPAGVLLGLLLHKLDCVISAELASMEPEGVATAQDSMHHLPLAADPGVQTDGYVSQQHAVL